MGKQTISRIAKAGPESKAHLLQSLGIQSVLITDGKTPINMIGNQTDGRLFDQVENLKKDITRLEYQNNELERDLREGGGSTGGGANKLNKRVEDLQERLLTRTDEVSEARRATADDPFPLFPGERLPESGSATDYSCAIKRLPTIKADHGIHLSALVDMEETDTAPARKAGDEWQLRGPLTYLPKSEEQVVKMVSPIIITPGHAVRLRARQAFTDAKGIYRCTGEEWLVRDIGAYLPDVYEEVVEEVDAYTLTPNNALHIRANCNFTDQFGRGRRIGEEWLVKYDDTESYIPDVTEEVVNEVQLTVLSHHQYCVVVNPLGDDGRPRLGCEKFERGIQDAIILESDEALLVTAQEEFDDDTEDGSKVHRTPGDRWMIHGPTDYIPRTEIGNIQRRKATPLNENEGIYVRNVQSGQVRAILGPQSYLLQAAEELYEKELTPLAEEILKEGGGVGDASIRKIAYFDGAKDPSLFKGNKRDKTRVVTYRCPSNCAVQVYNYIEKTARVLFGPDLVVLDPHENFNVLSLSGEGERGRQLGEGVNLLLFSAGKPKKENALKTICLMLGPDFISDHIT
uniref:Major vault protein n=1 Tax=Amphimedon queenslandica TaxID=400682 RepID=A0A1X7VCR4_AMPQE